MRTYYWTDGHGRIGFPITQAQIDSICHSGANDAAVAAESKPDIQPELARAVLREYGAWDDAELSDHAANLDRLFWLAAWDCHDEPEMYAADEVSQ